MAREMWYHKNMPAFTKWVTDLPLEECTPYTQVYGICFTLDGQICVQRQPGKEAWNLPGGTPEKGETAQDTLLREVDEEVSLTLKHHEFIGAFDVLFPDNPSKNRLEHYFELRYMCIIDEIKELTADPDIDACNERIFIPIQEFDSYIKWGEKGKEMFATALKAYNTYLDTIN